MTRRFYLVIFSLLLAAMALTGAYLRQRANRAAAAADCDTPAPPAAADDTSAEAPGLHARTRLRHRRRPPQTAADKAKK